ncbi:F-actin-capping protein subunit beta [Histomonas meleagridis]|uniref:F-actin-capping protein subunit beta n=1 Tax=Histomonas meleagridis TaxID=135588 RepID=UPI00355A0929|nr:F-actin-capping protein subunit beta [Histomonas meleagridis]KAH0799948.1 F-actin-capping protein subunit beta [Histomonas meleagridis]
MYPKVDAAHDLLRHVPPKDIQQRLINIISLDNDLANDLLSTVDTPFSVAYDNISYKQFIKCDYNRDCDSYRSPHSNVYFPPLDEGILPSDRLREMEIKANKVFQNYRQRYYHNSGICSVYCWDLDPDNEESFGIGVFIHRSMDSELSDYTHIAGTIDSSDVLSVTPNIDGTFRYEAVSSSLVTLTVDTDMEPLTLSGSVADQFEENRRATTDIDHLVNVGEMIEAKAANFYEKIKQIYITKMKEILGYTKTSRNSVSAHSIQSLQANAINQMFGRK